MGARLRRLAAFLLTLAALMSSAAHTANALPAVSEQLRSAIAPTGTLRAAINYNNPLLARRDPASGELSGVAVDLSRELAQRLGVKLELIPFGSAGDMVEAVKHGTWDIAYLGIDPARADEIDFTAPYLELEGTYLVPAGSPLHSIDQVDHDGIRIAVTANSAYDLYLSRALKHAQLLRAPTTPQSLQLLQTQKLDAVAAVKTALVAAAPDLAGSRVLPGHFMTIPQAAAVPRGRPLAAAYVRAFIEQMKASGFVAAALARHGLGPNDALVAPPEH